MPVYQFKKESVEKAILFIHIPKTGGTAIENYFKALGLSGFFDPASYRSIRPSLKIPPAHFDYEMCDKLFRLDRMYSFAIVRNPVQRMISEYRWAIQKSTLPDKVKKYSFSEFVEFALERYERDENFLAGHLKPQGRFVGERLSRIFKYENGLNAAVAEVFRDTGLELSGKIDVPMANSSGRLPVEVKDADVRAIQKAYADDFALFGYSPYVPEHVIK